MPQQAQRYLPEFKENGESIRRKNFNEWVYAGSPLTQRYIEPGSYAIYKQSGTFPEGTIKELQRARPLTRVP